jgi:hypothetical protein
VKPVLNTDRRGDWTGIGWLIGKTTV